MLFLFHLEEWELRPPSNYQLSSRQMSHCCPSPVFTVSDKRIAASRLLCNCTHLTEPRDYLSHMLGEAGITRNTG